MFDMSNTYRDLLYVRQDKWVWIGFAAYKLSIVDRNPQGWGDSPRREWLAAARYHINYSDVNLSSEELEAKYGPW